MMHLFSCSQLQATHLILCVYGTSDCRQWVNPFDLHACLPWMPVLLAWVHLLTLQCVLACITSLSLIPIDQAMPSRNLSSRGRNVGDVV